MEDQPTAFACPRCQGELDRRNRELFCTACRESYPTIAGGIAVLFPRDRPPEYVDDPGIPFRDALALAEKLAAAPGSFRDLVGLYYESLRAGCDPALFEYYRNAVANRSVTDVSGEIAGASLGLEMMNATFPRVRLAAEVGCGWGFSLASIGQGYKRHPCLSGARLCGLDSNPAILVIAQRLFRDLGLDNIDLAVADAEFSMPFRPGAVDFLFASSVVEHLAGQQASIRRWGQALSPDSVLYFSVPNRYTLHAESHFNCRGVGFVPRPWQKRYVGRRLGVPAKSVATIWSYTPGDLARLLCPTFSADLLAALPVHVPCASFFEKAVAKLIQPLGVNYYHCLVRRTPVVSLEPGLRGRLQVGSIVGRGPVRRVRVLNGPRPARLAVAGPSSLPLPHLASGRRKEVATHEPARTPS